jgi:hypothetical protein
VPGPVFRLVALPRDVVPAASVGLEGHDGLRRRARVRPPCPPTRACLTRRCVHQGRATRQRPGSTGTSPQIRPASSATVPAHRLISDAAPGAVAGRRPRPGAWLCPENIGLQRCRVHV